MVTVTDLNSLRALIAVLRAEGVTSFTSGDLRLELGVAPPVSEQEATPTSRQLPPEFRSLPPEYFNEDLGIRWEVK